MKTHLWYLMIVCLFLAGTGCSKSIDLEIKDEPDDDLIWDFICYNVGISVTDKVGNDLLDPQTPGNILNDSITVEYKGKTFIKDSIPFERTRMNMPAPLALRSQYVESMKKHLLSFGEFSPVHTYEKENLTIHWGDGTKDTISFDLYITWKSPKDPDVHQNIYLNGVLHKEESFLVTIIKQ